jgi:hypothetical protein
LGRQAPLLAESGADATATMQGDDGAVVVTLPARAHGELCRVPNVPHAQLDTGSFGCTALCFSPDGTLLAAACGDRLGAHNYCVKVGGMCHGTKLPLGITLCRRGLSRGYRTRLHTLSPALACRRIESVRVLEVDVVHVSIALHRTICPSWQTDGSLSVRSGATGRCGRWQRGHSCCASTVTTSWYVSLYRADSLPLRRAWLRRWVGLKDGLIADWLAKETRLPEWT